ncbi:protein O-mannosyl-transferase TMTC4-like isoform X1 [Helicoverpa zea]|uniref:protein O-mannosyl-transferase TMTC4-like isoform X1 n=1 Tax=Helicoverpa zea TaxID=7113 RepID=UPI001F587432|nr:protein O-mannosyl-transferase TMTC4-like isoform X1 [Helicoverpa zea]
MTLKLIILICFAVLPFIFSLEGEFVFDDSEAVVKNKDVTSESWTDVFFNDFWGTNIQSNLSHKSYRPLTVLSYRLNYVLSGRTLSAYHFKITNLFSHVVCCLLVWEVFQTILSHEKKPSSSQDETAHQQLSNQPSRSKKLWKDTAYLATLLFAVHPVHVEAVCGVVGRADLLAAETFFQAFLCYYKSTTSHKYKHFYLFTTVLLAGIAMLFKENGVTVLGFCLVYELTIMFWRKRNENRSTSMLRLDHVHHSIESVFRIICLSVGIAALLYARWLVMGRTRPEFKPTDNPAAFSYSPFTKVATFNFIYFLNLLLLIWPQWLCYDWSMGCVQLIERVTDSRIIFIYAMHLYGLFLLESVWSGRKKTDRAVVLAVSLIVIPFLPASNLFFPVGFVIAERILYISSAGYCLLLAIGFNRLLFRRTKVVRSIGMFMFIFLLLIYATRSWHRSQDWQTEHGLFISGLSVCPLNAKVHYNVAKAADANNQVDWALYEYKEAIRLYPKYYQAMNNLANLLKNLKKYEEAEMYLRSAVTHREDFPAAWMNLGILLATTRRFEESEAAYKTAISYRQKYPDCYYNLGNLYLEMSKTEDAIKSWFQAINLNPKHVLAWTNLMALMDNTGQIDRALKVIPKVLTELPDAPSINFAIANMYGKINRYEEAEAYFLRAIELFGFDVKAIHYANLGVLYHRWKKYAAAEEMYKNALKVDPSFKTARRNLENLQKYLNK